MRRLLVLLTVVTALTPGVALGQGPRARVWLPGYVSNFLLDTLNIEYELAAPPARVIEGVARVMAQWKLPVPVRDSVAGVVGTPEVKRTRVLAGERMSRFMYCGEGMTGGYADTYQVTVALLVLTDPLPAGGTRTRVGFAAGARDLQAGNMRDPVICQTNGALERKLVEAVAKELGIAAPAKR